MFIKIPNNDIVINVDADDLFSIYITKGNVDWDKAGITLEFNDGTTISPEYDTYYNAKEAFDEIFKTIKSLEMEK